MKIQYLRSVFLLAFGLISLGWSQRSAAADAKVSDNFADNLSGASGIEEISRAAVTFRLAAPVTTWKEGGGIPLGNGFTGGLLHGGGSHIELWLDRIDLWDERPSPIILEKGFNYRHWIELKEQGDWTELNRLFDSPWRHPTPTKLPGGQLEIALADGQEVVDFSVNLKNALAQVGAPGNTLLAQCFYSATDKVTLLRIYGPPPRSCKITAPSIMQQKMDYPAPQLGQDEDKGLQWFVQQVPEGMTYAVTMGQRRQGDTTLIALAMTASTTEGNDPLGAGQARVQSALDSGFDTMLKPHLKWWKNYWSASEVRVPDELQQLHYNLVTYLLGSVSRTGCPAMPGKGVWSNGMEMPSFRGGYHGDLTLQAEYGSYLTAGHITEGQVYIEHMWNHLPTFRKFAHDFYGTPGAIFPSVMSQSGVPETGYPGYALMPQGNGSWYAWLFYRHWLYTRDDAFLRDRAYPFCTEAGKCIEALLKPDAEGHLKTRISSSPELNGNKPECYLPPNSNYDEAGMLALFNGLADMAGALDKPDEAAHWRKIVSGLGGLWVDPETGALGFAPGMPFNQSHRHHSHLMAIYPYGSLTVEGSDKDRQTIAASMKLLDQYGTANWKNADPWDASFAWAACLKARIGDGDGALADMEIACTKGINRSGLSRDGNILEGDFLGMEAIHEMLLQRLGGVIRVFPAIPSQWQDAQFRDLHTEGGFRVSALRKDGRIQWVRIRSDAGQPCLVRTSLLGPVKITGCPAHEVRPGITQLDLPQGGEALLYTGDQPPRERRR